jgi:hypothetical protein
MMNEGKEEVKDRVFLAPLMTFSFSSASPVSGSVYSSPGGSGRDLSTSTGAQQVSSTASPPFSVPTIPVPSKPNSVRLAIPKRGRKDGREEGRRRNRERMRKGGREDGIEKG